ncbi:MAG TPA: zinc ribbon domain-containing protein [Anaerolineae bacterium]|nr:zinc ribbon domain-containing protein [Anaerolineae bacterium]
MPIYEYRCADCQKKVSVFFRSFSAVDQEQPRCPICQGTHLTKMVSKVRVIRGASSSGSGDDGFDDSALDDLNENDPRSLGRMMRRMADESGEDMGPEFGEVVNRLEKGEDPEAIEKSMPELAETGSDDGGSMGASMLGDDL